jgi:Enoyl-(Acyl carrier protein) reductase
MRQTLASNALHQLTGQISKCPKRPQAPATSSLMNCRQERPDGFMTQEHLRSRVGLRPHGMPETSTMKEAFDAKASGMTWKQYQEYLASTTHPRRVMTLEEVANMAVFMASDKASGMTGTTVNLTMGSLDD